MLDTRSQLDHITDAVLVRHFDADGRLVLVTYGALLGDAGLQHADIMERLRGEGQLNIYRGVAPAAESVDAPEDDAPPF